MSTTAGFENLSTRPKMLNRPSRKTLETKKKKSQRRKKSRKIVKNNFVKPSQAALDAGITGSWMCSLTAKITT